MRRPPSISTRTDTLFPYTPLCRSCESRNNGYQQCNVATNDRVELVRRLGGRCNAGRQWGYTSSHVWVNNGCRAEFGYGYRNVRTPEMDKDKGPSTGLIIGGLVVAGGLLELPASKSKKKKDAAGEAHTDDSRGRNESGRTDRARCGRNN